MVGHFTQKMEKSQNTFSVCARAGARFLAIALSLMLTACGSSSNSTVPEPSDGFFLPLTVESNNASNDPGNTANNTASVAGSVDWERLLDAELNEIVVGIPEDSSLQLLVRSANADYDISIVSFPEFGAAIIVDDVLEYTPNLNFYGTDRIRMQRDSVEYIVAVNVIAVNDAPVIIDEIDRVAEQGVRYSSQVRVRNVDQDTLSYSSSNLPRWLTLDESSGLLSGTPEQQDVGVHEGINLIVRDNGGLDDVLGNVRIEVLDVNDAPTLNITQFPDQLDARESVSVNVFPDDLDGDSVTLSIEANNFVSSSVNGGEVTVTAVDVIEVTEINLVLSATDQLGNVTREVLPLTLYPLTESGRGRTLKGAQSGSGIHLVVLGDGYRADQQTLFREDVEGLISIMEQDPAVAVHLSAWNIHMIETPSVDSGIDDNVASDIRDTAFDSGYFCLSVPRLICGDNRAMFGVALDEYPDLDELVLLVNDPRYGGSGGSVAVASSSAPEIALHEMGHSLANLGDEYVDNSIPAFGINEFNEGEFANISTHQDPALVPWSAWIDMNNTIPTEPGEDGVGVFQGGFYQPDVYFRPTFDSRMRTFDRPFGPVNGEAWALSVYRETRPVVTFFPRTESVLVNTGDQARFLVEPVFGPTIQRLVWTLDGVLLPDQINATEVNLLLSPGNHVLTLGVSDITGTIRKTGPHPAQFSWQWNITVQ